MRKSLVFGILKDFREEFNTEERVEKLLFIEKVEKGIKDAEEGRTIPLEEAKKDLRINGQQNKHIRNCLC